MKTTLILLNLMAALVALGSVRFVSRSSIFMAVDLYNDLDSAGLINHDNVAKMFPNQPDNYRALDVPLHFMRNANLRAWKLQPVLSGLFALNALLIAIFMQGKRKAEQSAGPYGSPGAGSPSGQP